MAVDPRKRQKKLERRNAKAKAERRELARRQSEGLPVRMRHAFSAPILHCSIMTELWKRGMGNILVSRRLTSGMVAFAAFLVDIYCLGVKDVFMGVMPRAQYDANVYDKMRSHDEMKSVQPEYARKLVEEAVRYADTLGFAPHKDYATAKLVFGDIAAEACNEEFTFGNDGMPFFIAGPNENASRSEQIVRTLHEHCGPGKYHYIAVIDAPDLECLALEADDAD